MSAFITVKPALGMRVLDPVTRKPLPEAGAEVPRSVYWLRRLRDGDVTEAPAQSAPKASSKSK